MAKITAPLLSMGAAGQIGKSMVAAKWRGLPYMRRYVVPANPNSTEQQKTRGVFKVFTQIWKLMDAGAQAPWMAYATGKALTDRNALLKFNVQALRGDADFTDLVGSPGANGGTPLTSFVATGGAGSIATTVGAPSIPTGWTLVKVSAIARNNDNPDTTTDYTTYYEEATVDPWQPAWAGLAAGDYQVSAWPVFTKDDGTTAYGPSSNHAATVT